MIVLTEVRREQPQRGEVDAPGPHRVKRRGQALAEPRHRHAIVRRAFGEPELADQEGEHRGMRELQVQLPRVDLAQVREQVGFHEARLRCQRARRRDQRMIVERRDFIVIHSPDLTPRICEARSGLEALFAPGGGSGAASRSPCAH